MKKIFLTSLFLCLFLFTGCGKYNEKTIVKDLNKKINQITGYHIEGTMDIYNGEDVYSYDVESSYENDNYRVSLTNKMNNHEQIILRNADGVYVLTPSLNKSFKFQSNWPENNSQAYILQSILSDINKDEKIKLEEKDGKYILNTKIAYSNNKNLVNQKIYMDKKLNFEKIEVFDESGNKQIKMVFDSIDTKATFDNKYFSTSENMKTVNIENSTSNSNNKTTENNSSNNSENIDSKNNNKEENISESEDNNLNNNKDNNGSSNTNTENNNINNNSDNADNDSEDSSSNNDKTNQTSALEDTVYPMYLPSGTYLSTEETVSKEDGERVILTFAGESPFILVEETISKTEEMEIIPVYGEPTILMDTIGALSETSVNFISNGVEYYIASEDLTMQEILEVAQSMSSVPIMK